MPSQSLFFYFLLFIFLLPLLVSGIIIIRKISSIEKFELLFPAGSIFGILFFIFCLNFTAYFIKGLRGVIFSYSLLIFFSVILYLKKGLSKIVFPKGTYFFLFIIGWVLWGALIGWKSNFALIGSDTNLYYGVAHSFIKGNFPPMTPWQPDLPLAYHLGAFELLGAFYALTGFSFEFLHIFFAYFFILFSAQIIIWLWEKNTSVHSFIWGNIASAVVLISFGFLKIVVPVFPLEIQNITNLHQFFLWIRNLPTVNQVIEVYGAPVNLDGLIYFIFHSLGLAGFLSLLTIIIHPGRKILFGWIVFVIGIVSLALVNESIFLITAPSLIFIKLLFEYKQNKIINWKFTIFFFILIMFLISFQSGMIKNNIFPHEKIQSSVILFPKVKQIKEDFQSYHLYQQISKSLKERPEWLPFKWNQIGVDILIVASTLSFIYVRFSQRQKGITLALFLSGVFSLIAYNYIIPKFLVANGNRFLAFSFIFFSLLLTFSFYSLIQSLTDKKNKLFKIFLLFLALWIFLPSLLPPFALLSKNRFGENKLLPKKEQISEGMAWMRDNLVFNSSVMVLDIRAPHPSGVARALTQAGVFSPLFSGDFRIYTIEASPEYFDIAYYLNSSAMQRLKVNILFIDSAFYATLPIARKEDLENKKYFDKIFDNSEKNKTWEKIYKVNNDYLMNGREDEGTFEQLRNLFSTEGRIYIDNEENFDPSYLRRAVIFSLRDKDIYYLPQSGVYLNVEEYINSHPTRDDRSYNYLILGRNTNPHNICQCQTKLIWMGLKNEILVWKKID